jgi:hypothetical protein
MSVVDPERSYPVYKIECEDGCRYVVYNASAIGNPTDHMPDKWYFRSYPARFPLGTEVGAPFETAKDAEQAARAPHVRSEHLRQSSPISPKTQR